MGEATTEWEILWEELQHREVPRELIASSIMKLGKPYDLVRIKKAKDAESEDNCD